jgi:hypothetical protein
MVPIQMANFIEKSRENKEGEKRKKETREKNGEREKDGKNGEEKEMLHKD